MTHTFVISDTHCFHANIIKYCDRPWLRPGDLDPEGNWSSREIMEARADEMTRFIIDRWNSVIAPNDVVYHCGDLAFGPRAGDEANIILLLRQLNGKLHLIKGNHDHAKTAFWEHEGVTFYEKGYHIIGGVMLCHYPTYIESRPEFTDSLKMQGIKEHYRRIYTKNRCRYIIYGHTHTWISPEPDSYNAGVEVNDYLPLEVNFEAEDVNDIIPHKIYVTM